MFTILYLPIHLCPVFSFKDTRSLAPSSLPCGGAIFAPCYGQALHLNTRCHLCCPFKDSRALVHILLQSQHHRPTTMLVLLSHEILLSLPVSAPFPCPHGQQNPLKEVSTSDVSNFHFECLLETLISFHPHDFTRAVLVHTHIVGTQEI